ncbi:MAG: putative hydro-lyase [Gemmatimonadota bacterium]|jgi:uncharacterized protein YcsI (UPF0317 family)
MNEAAAIRRAIRDGKIRGSTAGLAPGYRQANLLALPAEAAGEFRLFCERNARACPILEVLLAGETEPRSAPLADLRTDLPLYHVYRRGQPVVEVEDATPYWREDLTAFLLGCSYTFETELIKAGIPLPHVPNGRRVPMYRTNRKAVAAGRFGGRLVVSMRWIPQSRVPDAIDISERYPDAHGAPLNVDDPDELGIADLWKPDFGEAVPAPAGTVPVFWACGVTSLTAAEGANLPLFITHAPGCMFITDRRS